MILMVIFCMSCSSINSDDVRLMKEKTEYLLKIDSATCRPDLITIFQMESCYEMVRINQKFRRFRVVFHSIIPTTYVPARVIDGKTVNDKSKSRTHYEVIYHVYNGEELLGNKIKFTFSRDTTTQKLYCWYVNETYPATRNYHWEPSDDDDDEIVE